MELLASFFQAILDLGSSVFMPLLAHDHRFDRRPQAL